MSRVSLGVSSRQRDLMYPSRPPEPEIIPTQIYTIDRNALTTIAGEPINIIINPIKTIFGDNLETISGETLITI